ncbi:MAG TPA: methylated-DNA--[protein]-cysteine S-methyltransferase [Candidatus Saccharimonadales bacterium]|nr:methylated-DNA--[protein]-cysteine S-methyltransferase [Candidatus Saccharimonadales bacterium]
MLFAEPSEFFFTAGYDSPVGHLDLAMSERGLSVVAFHGHWIAPHGAKNVRWIEEPDRFREVTRQLDEYFGGVRQKFDLPLDLRGPEFHQKCWQGLLRIPFGQTWSYAKLAAEVGSPLASRAVGQANHHNPVAIIVPCHRVIASDGTLAGFGGGLPAKEFLLNLEGARFRPSIPEQRGLFGELAV